MMLIWFSMLGILGLIQVAKHPEVFKALNPTTPIIYYLYIRTVFRVGLCVFCTTGAEALYSDMGHCGRKIFGSVGFSKITLVLNYWPSRLFNPP
jgi:KUP system potassium uptake protein